MTDQSTQKREAVRFASGSVKCAAWHYPGTNGACVVMAGGFGVTKEPGTDRFAAAFHSAGFSVLAFDYRNLGQSDGEPRQVVRMRDQLADWHAAIGCAAELPEVDDTKLVAWGFSLSGGHVLEVAASDQRLRAAIAQSPNADGPAATRNAMRYQTAGAAVRLLGRSMIDRVCGLIGRAPLLVPLAGPPGAVALLTTPDAIDGGRILDPDGRYPEWIQAVAARSSLAVGRYRPGRVAARINCPLLVVACADDRSALAEPAKRAASAAPNAELVCVPGGHYAPFLDQHDAVVAAELEFLARVLAPAR